MGAWSFTPASALADGNYSVSAVETKPSAAGASAASDIETFTIDTPPPAVSSPTLTAPSDNLTPAANLAIVAVTLPSDGTVTLADGQAVTQTRC